MTALLVYVDDIIIRGNDEKEKQNLKQYLIKEFEIKELGRLKYFLGIEVSYLRPRIEMSKNFGDISEKYRLSVGSDTIFVTDYRSTDISLIFQKYLRYFGIYRYSYRFFGKFPDISTSPVPAQDTKSVQFFLKHCYLVI